MAKQGSKIIAAIAAVLLLSAGGAGAAVATGAEPTTVKATHWCC